MTREKKVWICFRRHIKMAPPVCLQFLFKTREGRRHVFWEMSEINCWAYFNLLTNKRDRFIFVVWRCLTFLKILWKFFWSNGLVLGICWFGWGTFYESLFLKTLFIFVNRSIFFTGKNSCWAIKIKLETATVRSIIYIYIFAILKMDIFV